jgi:VWFA-related protein
VPRLLLLLVTVAAAVAQEPAFKTRSRLVIVLVSVSDKHVRSIDGLSDSDFTLLDNGQRRSVQVDPAGTYLSGISLTIVVQASGISKAALLKIRKTGSLIDGYISGEDGEAAVLSATDQVRLRQDFTTDSSKIRNAFRNVELGAERDGHVLDAVATAIHMLETRPADRRRLVLLISESRDRGSSATPQEVLTSAQKNNVTIYTVTYSAYITPFTTRASDLGPPSGGMDLLAVFTEIGRLSKENIGRSLSEYTGGRHLSFETLSSFENDFVNIGKEVHSQYLLSFVPDAETAPAYHRLSISVKDRPDAIIRARPGYWTSAPDTK